MGAGTDSSREEHQPAYPAVLETAEVAAPRTIPPPARLDTLARAAVSPATRSAILLRPDRPLHLANALRLVDPLARLSADVEPRLVLLMDHSAKGVRRGPAHLNEASIDRLAMLPAHAGFRIARATAIPAISQLATIVATVMPFEDRLSANGASSWFQEVLLAAGLMLAGATHAIIETAEEGEASGAHPPRREPAREIALARKLAGRLNAILPGLCPFPVPLVSGFGVFRSLDGNGAMGVTPKGTIWLSDSADIVTKKIRTAKTDLGTCFDPTHDVSPEVINLLLLLHALGGERMGSLIERFTGKGYGHIKAELAEAANAFLEPIRLRREELAQSHDLAAAIAAESAEVDRGGSAILELLNRRPDALSEQAKPEATKPAPKPAPAIAMPARRPPAASDARATPSL